jgi:hypothetical protein
MSCSFTEKISSLIDGELATAEAREVERHVLTCGECAQVKADFLNLRSEIAGFESSLQPTVQNRALKKILSRGERATAHGWQWGWSTSAIAFASLLLVGAIIGLILYQTSRSNDRHPNTIAEVPSSTPVPTPEQTPTKEEKEQQPATPKQANPPAPSKKAPSRQPRPGEQFAAIPNRQTPDRETPNPEAPERIRSADSETLTAIHFERSETLLRAFRNVRLNTREGAADVAYERKRAKQLVLQNMILRREADANGDVQSASLLENLEPILLDIANLPDKPDANAVRTIRERVERKNIVPLLQINSAALARALD